MKQMLILALLLCLILIGCQLGSSAAEPTAGSLPQLSASQSVQTELPTEGKEDMTALPTEGTQTLPQRKIEEDPSEPDVVTICEGVPTETINESRWQAFLTASQNGQSDALTVRLKYGKRDIEELELRYDGEMYWLKQGKEESAFRYLLVCQTQEPPINPSFHGIYYILSDDPQMTYNEYMAYLASSQLIADFPPTIIVFSIYYL